MEQLPAFLYRDINCGSLLEGDSNKYQQHMIWRLRKKNISLNYAGYSVAMCASEFLESSV